MAEIEEDNFDLRRLRSDSLENDFAHIVEASQCIWHFSFLEEKCFYKAFYVTHFHSVRTYEKNRVGLIVNLVS